MIGIDLLLTLRDGLKQFLILPAEPGTKFKIYNVYA